MLGPGKDGPRLTHGTTAGARPTSTWKKVVFGAEGVGMPYRVGERYNERDSWRRRGARPRRVIRVEAKRLR